ncbi:hypothetical protein MferCBS31731_006233 [Microsporum ferrugineum]
MPTLSEVSYSRQDCIAAFRDYFHFLTTMYLAEDAILEPPEGGWPSVTSEAMRAVGKNEEVASLLRYLPYIATTSAGESAAQVIPYLYFADWPEDCAQINSGRLTGEAARETSESYLDAERVPPHVVSLTSGGRDNAAILLDTKLGIILWPECPVEIRCHAFRDEIQDDAYDYAPENEADWRGGGSWAITDFFEVLKNEFRKLYFVPLNSRTLYDTYTQPFGDLKDIIPMLQEIYRKHGWPSMELFNKRRCLAAVLVTLEDKYPDYADR